MNLEEEVRALAKRIDNVEILLQLQSLTITTLLAMTENKDYLLQCMRGIYEQQDARGLYATSLSDDQLHRVLAGFQAQIAEIERRFAPYSPR